MRASVILSRMGVFGMWCACMAAFAGAPLRAAAAEPLPPAAEWIPAEAEVALEVVRPKAILDTLLDSKLSATVMALPPIKQAFEQPKLQQLRNATGMVQLMLGTDWKTALRKAFGGGVTLAASPRHGALLIVDAEDEEFLKKVHETLLQIAKAEAAKQNKADAIQSADYQGVTCWTFDGKEGHALLGRRLVLSDRREVLKAALDLRAKAGGQALAALPAYQAAKRAAGGESVAWGFLNWAAVKEQPATKKALGEYANPGAALLAASLNDALRQSNWLAVGLKLDGEALSLRAMIDGRPSAGGVESFAAPALPDGGTLPNLDVPRKLAGISLYRDLKTFYGAKDKLFPERTSGLVFFENMMEIFFSGRELTSEVMGEARPEIRLVAAAQAYDPAVGTPQPQVPAMAAVFRVRNPQQFANVIEEAWQKGLGLLNFTRGQQALQGMIMDRDVYGDVRYSLAYFAVGPNENKAQLPIRYNFRPTLAKLNDYVILSSTDALAKDLIDALKKEAAKPLASVSSLVELSGPQVAAVFQANRTTMAADNMVKKGISQEEAERELDVAIGLMKLVDLARLSLAHKADGSELELALKLRLP